MSFTQTLSLLSALVASVAAHGHVTGVVANGKWHQNYEPVFQFYNPEPEAIGWKVPLGLDNGFVDGTHYNTLDIACHKSAGNAQLYVPVTAGSNVELQWTDWPESHHGPVIDYLASCNGDCGTISKSDLRFFKISGVGLIDGSQAPGKWAADELIANNNTWSVKIPSDIKPGKYVLRHEIIALHDAGRENGAQNYPQCINLDISGSGSATPQGVAPTALYKTTDPGIKVSIYQPLSSYIVPGPALYTGGGGSTNPQPNPSPSANPEPTPTTVSKVEEPTPTTDPGNNEPEPTPSSNPGNPGTPTLPDGLDAETLSELAEFYKTLKNFFSTRLSNSLRRRSHARQFA